MHWHHTSTHECCLWYVFTEFIVVSGTESELGQLVGVFGKHYNYWSGETEAMFTALINKYV
jgi:hypothetical protein